MNGTDKNMKLLAVIVAYRPDIQGLRDNISRFIGKVDRLLLWRNSQIADDELFAGGGESWRAKVGFCGDGVNAGIPKALNYGWHYARQHGYTHLMTMDQDSLWEDLDVFLEKVSAPDAPAKGFFGPLPVDVQWAMEGSCVMGFTPCPDLITSGMLIPLSVLDAVGGWREDFLVDAVDTDFCRHAMSLGFTPYLVGGCRLVQHFGSPTYVRFLWKSFRCGNYSPARLYGIYRNHVIVIRSYPKEVTADLRKSIPRSALSRAFRILIGERQKPQKLWAILRGLCDGLRYKTPERSAGRAAR